MKLAWFTPFTNKSAIGKYSQIATRILSKKHNVSLFVSKNESNLHLNYVPVVRYSNSDPDVLQKLENYDFLIYNFGDNYQYHKDILGIYKKKPGISIIHDYYVHNFFRGYFMLHKNRINQYLRTKRLIYNDFKNTDSINLKEIDAQTYLDILLINSLGIIVHSGKSKDEVERVTDGLPIEILKLPYFSDVKEINRKINNQNAKKNKIHLLTIGHVNQHKRIHVPLTVLGKVKELRYKVTYDIVGQYDKTQNYYKYLLKLINTYKLEDVVKFHGYTPDNKLNSFLSEADICINLRYPVLAGGSWSLLDQFYAKKPVIVSDADLFSELPNDVVIKNSIGKDEELSMRKNLLYLIDHLDQAKKIGDRAYNYLKENYNEKQYMEKFDMLLKKVEESKNISLLHKITSELGLFVEDTETSYISNIFAKYVSFTE